MTRRADYLTRVRKSYLLAQGLADKATLDWATTGDVFDRVDHIKAIYTSLVDTRRDPALTVQEALSKDRGASDALSELTSVVQEAAFLYGLAVATAMMRGARS